MQYIKRISTLCCTILFWLCATVSSNAQSLDFKNFDSDMGLPQNFVYCLTQDHKGYLWIGTGEGLVRYDGLDFTTYTVNDSLSSDFVHSLYVDNKNTLWVGHKNGKISYYENNKFHKIKSDLETSSPIRDICEDELGNIWATVQNNGLIKITPNKEITSYFNSELFGDKLYYSLESINAFSILIGTSDGLELLHLDSNGSPKNIETIEDIAYTNINSIVKRRAIEGEYWIGTEDSGFFLFKYDKKTASHVANNNLCIAFNIEEENIIDIFEDDNGDLLLATWGNGVIKLFYDSAKQSFRESYQFSKANGLNHDFIKQILTDREGNYWIATYGSGISVLLNDKFIRYDLENIGFKQHKAVAVLSVNNNIWIGLDNGILKADEFCFTNHEYYDSALGIPNDRITGFKYDKDSTLWVSSLNKGLYYRKTGQLNFNRYNYSNNIIDNKINDIEIIDNKLVLATVGGLFTINLTNEAIDKLTTQRGLPHNCINFIYVDRNNKMWIGPKSSGICKIDNNNIEIHKLAQTPINVSGMTEDREGNYWLSTIGKGVLKYNNDNLESISISDGLTKNYCYDIICDKNDQLWICHWPGISSINLNTNQIRQFGFADNLGSDFYKLWEDNDRNIWFASSKGIIKYFPDRDKKNLVPPMLNFTNVLISGKSYINQKVIKLPYPYGNESYKLKFEFTGISFKSPSDVTYKIKMEEKSDTDSNDWIDLGLTNFREYEYLPDGEYTFKVMAKNADNVETSKPISIKIIIATPFWKKLWFYILVVIASIASIRFIIMFRERKIKAQNEYLAQEVASKTVILRQQNEEIKQKNQDITDSITYAKKIQRSILPPLGEFENIFPESFIFFKPRDIVSGDFYWFKKTKDLFILCCADCTGHGVPGAFMSMIGSTLLNDIFKLPNVNSPAEMLERLDNDIRVLLQKGGDEHSKDGMDISVVEINLNTNKVRLASAKRPVFLYINDELTIYNGTRRSIGDDELTTGSRFVNYEYNCDKGDIIYLFSDGYTDQFGGPNEKKFMKSGVKKLLHEIHNKPMQNQGSIVKDNFLNWMGDCDQIDDVLFMGIRL
ncbi:two-component regulator propeller domain-containing protein [Saccharicrinis aurantiacus]|uniref:two-component regulator propeller domain-containing protein n=1 Tax=Saccharicrinis aurantiacus TaxID=1849719 RepID=UPI00083845FF|nr:two-component regulator propeller domain-containing protein [Saccharicrinis aurantiacus]